MMVSRMRWLVLALLVANGSYYYWQHLRGGSVERLPDTSGASLVLLSEIPAPVAAIEPEPRLEVAEASVKAPKSRWFGDGVTTQLEEITLPEWAKRKALPGGLVAQAETPPEVDAVPEPDSSGEQEMAEAAPVLQCWRAGPLEESASEFLARDFSQQGLKMRLLPRQVVTETKYWVYVETANDPEIRKQTRAALLEAGVDNYVIAAGALGGDLSLGLFRNKNRAERIAVERRKQGFLAKVYPVEKVEEKNWLLIDSEEIGLLGWPADAKHVPGLPELKLKVMKCGAREPSELQGRRRQNRAPASSQLALTPVIDRIRLAGREPCV